MYKNHVLMHFTQGTPKLSANTNPTKFCDYNNDKTTDKIIMN